MIRKLSLRIALLWQKIGVISSGCEELEVYCYGLELVFSTLLNVIFIFLISILLKHPFACVSYLLSFIPLRITAGGYHAKSHWLCIVICAGAYSLSLLSAISLIPICQAWCCLLISITAFSIFMVLAPVPAPNKPLSTQERTVNRKKTLVFSGICTLLAVINILLGWNISLGIEMFFWGEGIVALSLLAAVSV